MTGKHEKTLFIRLKLYNFAEAKSCNTSYLSNINFERCTLKSAYNSEKHIN